MNQTRICPIVYTAEAVICLATLSSTGSPGRHRLEEAALGFGIPTVTKATNDHHRHELAAVTPAAYHYGRDHANGAKDGSGYLFDSYRQERPRPSNHRLEHQTALIEWPLARAVMARQQP